MTHTISKSNKNIMIGTVIGYVNLILSVLSGFLFIPWIIKSIGSDNYGLYTLSNSLITLFLFDFGMSTTINSYLSKLRAKGDEDGIKKFLSITYKIYIVIDIILLIVFSGLYFGIDYIYSGLTPVEKQNLKVVFLITACFNLISFPASSFNGVLQAYEQFFVLKILELLNKVLYVVLSFVCLYLNLGLFALVIANCFSGLISIAFKFLFLTVKLKIKTSFKIKIDKKYFKDVLLFSGWAAIYALASRLVFNIMPTILGIVSNSDNITLFSVGASLEGYVYSFSAIMNGFFLPRIALIKERFKDDPHLAQIEIGKLASRIGKIQLSIISLIVIGFLCIGSEFIDWWMGNSLNYHTTYIGTLLIISTQIIFVPQLIFYTQMFMEKNTMKQLAICSLIKASINIVLSFVFGYYLGALGAYLSIFIARFIEVIIQNYLYRKFLKVDLVSFFKRVYFKTLIPIVLSIGFGFLAKFLILDTITFINIVKAILMIVVHFVLFFVLFFDKEDKRMLLSIGGKK